MPFISEKGASCWLTVLPLSEDGYVLHKGAFRDVDMVGLHHFYHLTVSVDTISQSNMLRAVQMEVSLQSAIMK